VADQFPDWQLEVIGEGPDRQALEDLVSERSLQSRVSLPGFVSDVPTRMAKAGVFVLSSRYEGLPNVLIEAMASGAAVLATRCSGAIAVVRDDFNGRLTDVDDECLMATKLGELMARPDDRRRLGAAAMAVRDEFRLTKVLDLWEETLRGCLEKRRSSPASQGRAAA
jgi:glycosyltransferase involved in cell wall biosynthesis